MAENTQVAEQPKQTFKEALTTSLVEVKDALPENFNVMRFVLNSVALLNDNDQLAKFAKEHGTAQIKAGIMKAAYLGLDFSQREAYLIPYGSTLNFMLDYRGNVKLCKRYSTRKIKDIYAKVVREGDEFTEKIVDGKPSIDFTPKPFNDGPIIGAFAVVLFEDGGMDVDTMSLRELENTRKSSKMANGPAWKNFTAEMYRKTVLHRLCKHIDIAFDRPEQAQYFNEDMEIETDVKAQVEQEIAENANMTPFDDDEIVVDQAK